MEVVTDSPSTRQDYVCLCNINCHVVLLQHFNQLYLILNMVDTDFPLVKVEFSFSILVDRFHNPWPNCCHLRSLGLVYDCTKEVSSKGRSCYIQKCRVLVFRVKIKLCGISCKPCVTPCSYPRSKVPSKDCCRYQYDIRFVILYDIHE